MATKAKAAEFMILRLIHDRGLTVGQSLPTEEDLASMAGVSRGSIRTSLRNLRDQGIIQSKKGSGTTLLRVPSEIPDTSDAIVPVSATVQTGPVYTPIGGGKVVALDDRDALLMVARGKLGGDLMANAFSTVWTISNLSKRDESIGMRVTISMTEPLKVNEGGMDTLYKMVLETVGSRSGDIVGQAYAATREQAERFAGAAADNLPKNEPILMIEEALMAATGPMAGRTVAFSRLFFGQMQAFTLSRGLRV